MAGCPPGLSQEPQAWSQHLSRRKPPLFPTLVPTSLTTTYCRSICLPRHWKMLHMEGQPH